MASKKKKAANKKKASAKSKVEKEHVVNGVIQAARLGFTSNDEFLFALQLQFEGAHSTVGSRDLSKMENGLSHVQALLQAVSAPYWEQLQGRPVRIKIINNKVVEIGHYLEERWYKF